MIKKATITLMVMIFSLTCLAVAFAAEGPGGNKRKGKYTYRTVYKKCSASGEVESAKPTVSPADKKMGEWKVIFENKDFSVFGCLDQWSELSDGEILDIYSYFYNYAADSPSPATCK